METEVFQKDHEQKYIFDRAMSCDVNNDHCDKYYSKSSDTHKAPSYSITHKNQELEKLIMRNTQRYFAESNLNNSQKCNAFENSEDLGSSGVYNSAFDEYMHFPTSNVLRNNVNPMACGYLASKNSREVMKTANHTERGLFSKNEKINSRKQYFHKIGESLNKEAVGKESLD